MQTGATNIDVRSSLQSVRSLIEPLAQVTWIQICLLAHPTLHNLPPLQFFCHTRAYAIHTLFGCMVGRSRERRSIAPRQARIVHLDLSLSGRLLHLRRLRLRFRFRLWLWPRLLLFGCLLRFRFQLCFRLGCGASFLAAPLQTITAARTRA